MVPIFNFRSILSIVIGLVIGAGLGLGYYSFNNATAELNPGWPPIQIVRAPDSTRFEAIVQGRVMPKVFDDTYLRNMDSQGQYYAARMSSLTFFEYFNNSIARENPQYIHTPEELSRLISVRYVTLADNPSVIEIKASCTTSQESLFMLRSIPKVFESYLQSEQNNLQLEVYQNKLRQLDITRTALLQAGQDLVNSITQDLTPPTTLSKEYIELSERIATLQTELNDQSKKAANLLAEGYAKGTVTVSPIPTPSLNSAPAGTNVNTNPAILAAQIKALEDALAYNERRDAGYIYTVPPDYPTSGYNIEYEEIHRNYQQAKASVYTNTINALERLSSELSIAKTAMNQLQAKVFQEKMANDSANQQKKLAYTFANSQITSLTAQLDAQTKDILATDQTIPTSQIPKFFMTTAPVDPLPVNPAKNAPIIGALAGMFCGWLVVNRRWLVGGKNAFSLNTKEYEDADIALPDEKTEGISTAVLEREAEDTEGIQDSETGAIRRGTDHSEDDDWLNGGIQKLTDDELRKQDEEWLNSGISQEEEAPSYKETSISDARIKKASEDPLQKEADLLDEAIRKMQENLLNSGTGLSDTITNLSKDSIVTPESTFPNLEFEKNLEHPVNFSESQTRKTNYLQDEIISKEPEISLNSQAFPLADNINEVTISRVEDAPSLTPNQATDACIKLPDSLKQESEHLLDEGVKTEPDTRLSNEGAATTDKPQEAAAIQNEDLLNSAVDQLQASPIKKNDTNPWTPGKLIITLEGEILMQDGDK